MRTRTLCLLTFVASLLVGTFVAVAASVATPATAHACSIAGPSAEVWPAKGLQPGQRIEVVGWSFIDAVPREPQSPTIAPPDTDVAVPPIALCDFDVIALDAVPVVWQGPGAQGEFRQLLGTVTGPDFVLGAAVPDQATTGPAAIVVGPVTLSVSVGPDVVPPPPPEPWPCPVDAPLAIAPSPGGEIAPGFLPPCPAPCVAHAHTTDAGAAHEFGWDCPDPCGLVEVNPGAEPEPAAVWCPPPDPCWFHVDGVEPAPDAVWCPPPDPCPVHVDGAEPAPDAVWCPDPCWSAADATTAVWCPPPDPCWVHVDGAEPAPDAVWCPDPCWSAADATTAVWCPPPDPCSFRIAGEAGASAAIACPVPLPVEPNFIEPSAAASSPAETSTAQPSPAQPSAAATGASESGPVQPAAESAVEAVSPNDASVSAAAEVIEPLVAHLGTAATAVGSVAQRVLTIMTGVLADLFG